MRILIIPAAGKGSRFAEQGYPVPKPMIRLSTGNIMLGEALRPFLNHVDQSILIFSTEMLLEQTERIGEYVEQTCQEELAKLKETSGDEHRELRCEGVDGLRITHQPLGAAMTILSMQGNFPDDAEIVIVNSDQIISQRAIDAWFRHIQTSDLSGSLLTFRVADKEDRRWSFVDVDQNGYVTKLVEKEHISDAATCGAYYFRSWAALRLAIAKMVAADDRANGEFYLAPAYNYLGGPISAYGTFPGEFASLGTPELLQAWEAHNLQKRHEQENRDGQEGEVPSAPN